MSKIKGLFTNKPKKVLSSKSLTGIVSGGIESTGYLHSEQESKDRFFPYVDYSNPANFARYASAEKYYDDTIGYIIGQYPYDGSLREKLNWHYSGSYFDNYIFDNEYPRTTGYITHGTNYGTITTRTEGYDSSTKSEYIYFLGGPHTASAGMVGTPLAATFTGSNYYSTGSRRESNLEINGSQGNTLEFWINKQSYNSDNEARRQVVFDTWNNTAHGLDSYGRFRVQLSGTHAENKLTPVFEIELISGSSGLSADNRHLPSPTIKMTATSLTGSWNHFALSFINSGSQMAARLYQNGSLKQTLVAGTSIGKITGSMLGQVGALMTTVSGTYGARGYAKLSASLDEVRFWKTQRNDTQIGRYWFTQVGGGTNTDEANVDLGVYYKFNEGIMDSGSTSLVDSNILDYSGRITNGVWTGYEVGSRFTNSAMVEASASKSEFKDPILYATQPQVSSFINSRKEAAIDYDFRNNSSIYGTYPEWITSDPKELNGQNLKNVTQIIGSFFDNLQLQVQELPRIKDITYATGSNQKVYPFVDRSIESIGLNASEIFADAEALEYYASRDDFREFSEKLSQTKNKIYQNVYNNLVHIFKSKGSEKSFRNLIRCFGIDEPLVRINLYADELSYQLKDNFRSAAARKKYINFNDPDRFDSTVYQYVSDTTNLSASNFISGGVEMSYVPNTMEAEIFFPNKFEPDETFYFDTGFVTASLFGVHETFSQTLGQESDYRFAIPDIANFQVQFVRTERGSRDGYFQLSSSGQSAIPKLTSSVYRDVYNNEKWNLGVRVKPERIFANGLSGSSNQPYLVEFVGYNSLLDNVENNFYLTGSLSFASGSKFLSSPKRVYCGAERQNFTGSTVLQYCDTKISSVRYWISDLPNEAIQAHSKDASSFGTLMPHRNAYMAAYNQSAGFNVVEVPQIKTLALNWSFDNVTGSNDSSTGSPTLSDATFIVDDMTSGSNLFNLTPGVSPPSEFDYGWLSRVVNTQHPGRGDFFLPFDTGSVSREYVYSAKLLPPDVLNSGDMVSVRLQDDDLFTRETRPINYFYAIEKSQAAIISEEIIKWFATIKDFNNLIGKPVNRYRQNYKALEKLRERYFETIGNTIDFEKFVDYFKWVDGALSDMLAQLIPASANFADSVRLMVEDHILERNKYWTKFPTLEMKTPDPEAGLYGITEMLYPYRRASAPIPISSTASNCVWWKDRAEASANSSGDADIDGQRNKYRIADDFRSGSGPTVSTAAGTQYEASAYALRNFTKIYRFALKEMPEIHGGSNFPRAKKIEYTHDALNFDSPTQLDIAASDIAYEKNCDDVVDPNKKERLEYKLKNSSDPHGYSTGKGTLLAPFSLFSSSVNTGYASDVSSNFRSNTAITNYHDDTYGDDKGIPTQGPFTEAHVGGRQHRHVDVFTPESSRPEAWDLTLASNTLTLSSRSLNEPHATYVRDEYAKRPVNIRNIKWGTGSQVIGNYTKDYQIIQTSGRRLNNRFFTKNEGFNPVASPSDYINGLVDYELPRYDLTGTNQYIFVERFNAPGGPEVSSRASMDLCAEEYAVYNDLNWRNPVVREALNAWYTQHCGQFGIDPTGSPGDGTTPSEHTVNALSYNGVIANYHKVNRNPWTVPTDASCSINYDNWFIQHPIPQSDYQYAWITASTIRPACTVPFGHAGSSDCGRTNFTYPLGSTSTTGSGLAFLTASCWMPASVLGCGTQVNFAQYFFAKNVTDKSRYKYTISGSTNTLHPAWGFVSNLETAPTINAHFNNINGPYQRPSWKQIRGGELAIPRNQRLKNVYSFVGKEKISEKSPLPDQAAFYQVLYHFTESAISWRHDPLVTVMKVQGSKAPVEMVHTYGNNLSTFINPSINNLLGTTKCDEQIYDKLLNLYQNITSPNNPVEEFWKMEYNETIFPKEINTGLNRTRTRTNYAEKAPIIFPVTAVNGAADLRYTSWATAPGAVGGYYTTVASHTGDSMFRWFVSSGDYSQNGIDRSPLERRTFWRDTACDKTGFVWDAGKLYTRTLGNFRSNGQPHPIQYGRNRDAQTPFTASWNSQAGGFILSGNLQTSVISSQGFRDGRAPSIFPFGSELHHTQTFGILPSTVAPMHPNQTNYDYGELDARRSWGTGYYFGGGGGPGTEGATILYNYDYGYFQYRGPVSGYYGTSSNNGNGNYQRRFPTASICYTNHKDYWGQTIFGPYFDVPGDGVTWVPTLDDWGPRFRVPEHAPQFKIDGMNKRKKTPWFDSYEEFAQDVRIIAPNYSVVSEFNISDHLDYYVETKGGQFNVPNDDFLQLRGAEVTSSGYGPGNTGFNSSFFTEYAHSDFQKYFDMFVDDHEISGQGVSSISLTCRAVKKLLPYNGFYPVSRTVQLAQMFSQSYAPHIAGHYFETDLQREDNYNSGALATQALLQPFFAPGIMYNTIKSGIAVDWAAFTGSLAFTAAGYGASTVALTNTPNFRIQFESLLDIENGSLIGGIPISGTSDAAKILWAGPEYLTQNEINNGLRNIYFAWKGKRTNALYSMAMHNFLAESMNFFLDKRGVTAIVSKPANQLSTMINGAAYYMDVSLKKNGDILMYGGRHTRENPFYHDISSSLPYASPAESGGKLIEKKYANSYVGKFFGVPYQWFGSTELSRWGSGPTLDGVPGHLRQITYNDPAYAPYLPPYFWGESIVRIKYVADGTEGASTDPITKILNGCEFEYLDPDFRDYMSYWNSNTDATIDAQPAWRARANISGSINLLGVTRDQKATWLPPVGGESHQGAVGSEPQAQVVSLEQQTDSALNRWVISTKYECPILNFKNQTPENYRYVYDRGPTANGGYAGYATSDQDTRSGSLYYVPRGMWSGYGEFPTGKDGVELSIKNSFPGLANTSNVAFTKAAGSIGSLADIMGFSTEPQQIGKPYSGRTPRTISEAIVAIPFIDGKSPVDYAKTTHAKVVGKRFFSMFGDNRLHSRKVFNQVRRNIERFDTNTGQPSPALTTRDLKSYFGVAAGDKQENTTSKLIDQMKKYILPPELDFLKYDNIEPFVMYMFEFESKLSPQDVMDIWQGVMPTQAMKADRDEEIIQHKMKPWEFFGGKKLPPEVRWLVFKIKQHAKTDYYKMTADSRDDARFKFKDHAGTQFEPEYSYNWPYDFCSLVESIQIDAGIEISALQKPAQQRGSGKGKAVPLGGKVEEVSKEEDSFSAQTQQRAGDRGKVAGYGPGQEPSAAKPFGGFKLTKAEDD